VEVRPVAEGVHLVEGHALEVVGAGVDGVDDRVRLAVAEGHDHLAARSDVVEDGPRRHRPRHLTHAGKPPTAVVPVRRPVRPMPQVASGGADEAS
jgi:hypothetical protein